MDISNALRKIRRERKMNKYQLVKKVWFEGMINCTPYLIDLIEAGVHKVNKTEVTALAKAMEVPAWKLMA